jgi:7-alpha-hydroxysteroid dehydrogenase
LSEHRPLENKVALITGASRGIGKGIALSFAEAGADLLLAARSMDDLKRTAVEARAHGVRAETTSMDALDLDHTGTGCLRVEVVDIGRSGPRLANYLGGGDYAAPA